MTFTTENPTQATVVLEIMDLQGRLVARQKAAPGQTRLSWDGTHEEGQPVASGTYLYRLRVGDRWSNGKVVKRP